MFFPKSFFCEESQVIFPVHGSWSRHFVRTNAWGLLRRRECISRWRLRLCGISYDDSQLLLHATSAALSRDNPLAFGWLIILFSATSFVHMNWCEWHNTNTRCVCSWRLSYLPMYIVQPIPRISLGYGNLSDNEFKMKTDFRMKSEIRKLFSSAFCFHFFSCDARTASTSISPVVFNSFNTIIIIACNAGEEER